LSEPAPGLLDTSVFIARESGRPLGELPDRVAVSVVTIGSSSSACWRPRTARVALAAPTRSRSPEAPTRSRSAKPSCAPGLGSSSTAAAPGRAAPDSLIAATAVEHGLPLVTQNEDYDRIAAVHAPLELIKV
jgi:predicted nucleic acid-binding protein